jgi:hypothetical protein
MGTNTQRYLDDSEYKGLRQRRATGAEFDALMSEFVSALKAWQPHMLVQWEDFGNSNAFRWASGALHCTAAGLRAAVQHLLLHPECRMQAMCAPSPATHTHVSLTPSGAHTLRSDACIRKCAWAATPCVHPT